MPLTPLHLAAGLPFRKRISLKAFILTNILIDLEPGAIMFFGMGSLGYPLHQWFHTLGGATALILITLVCGIPYRGQSKPWLYGSLLGGYSHIALDALVHPDVHPFSPWLKSNPFFLDIHAEVSILCAAILTYYLAKWVESLRIGEVGPRFIKDAWRRFTTRILGK